MTQKDHLQNELKQHGPITDLYDSGCRIIDNLLMKIGDDDVRWADTIKRAVGIAPGRDPKNLIPLYEKLRLQLIITTDQKRLTEFANLN